MLQQQQQQQQQHRNLRRRKRPSSDIVVLLPLGTAPLHPLPIPISSIEVQSSGGGTSSISSTSMAADDQQQTTSYSSTITSTTGSSASGSASSSYNTQEEQKLASNGVQSSFGAGIGGAGVGVWEYVGLLGFGLCAWLLFLILPKGVRKAYCRSERRRYTRRNTHTDYCRTKVFGKSPCVACPVGVFD